ncbi:MAG: hypothetical protein IBX63_06740, partial [Coriobacteriia bacterium]|nr:hypothetical protein [Coriobacteriia bacterium]
MRVSRVSRFAASLLVAALVFTIAPVAPAPEVAVAALPTVTLNAVTFVPSSTTVIAVGASGTILRSTNDGASWTSVGPGGTNNFTGVSFRNASNGLAVSSTGTVFYTSNGGASWSLSSPNLDGDPYSGTVHDVAFVESGGQSTAFASGRLGQIVTNTASATIWQRMTTDGGGEWVPPIWDRFYTNPSLDNAQEGAGDFYALDFPSGTRGYAVGHDRYKESSKPAPYNKALIYIYSGSPTPTWSTDDSAKRLADGTGPLYAVSFATEARGVAVGTDGKVFRTIDSGNVWTQSSAGSTDLLGAAMTTQNNGWVVGKGGVAGRTTNGGGAWSMQTIAAGIELRDVATRGGGSNTAVAVGTSGRIMRTTNGTDWSQAGEASVPTGTITLNSGDAATNSTNVTATHTVNWGGGGTGQMRHSVDGGTSWIGGGDGWVTYAATRSISLPAGDGTKTVRVGFKAADDTESTALIEDTIVLDTTAPTGTIAINGGAAATNATDVTVDNAVDFAVSGVHATEAMRFTVNGGTTWSTWEPYAASKALTLPAGDGTKTVTGEFKDAAGNVASLSDTIVLDTTAPTGTIAING